MTENGLNDCYPLSFSLNRVSLHNSSIFQASNTFAKRLRFGNIVGTVSFHHCKTVYVLAGCAMESLRPIFKTVMLICQSKVYLDMKALFVKSLFFET